MPRFRAAFTALLLLVVTGASAVSHVSPPTDVRIECRNSRVTASWECGTRQQPTSFEVTIKGASQQLETETTECHYDFTSFLWGSESHYMDNYFVTVVAVEGAERSESVVSRTFSFNRVKTVDETCSLDFPPVDVKPKDSGVLVSFANPLNFCPELRRAKKSNGVKFSFDVTSNFSHFEASCSASDEICKCDVHFAGGEEECVTLTGILFDDLGVGQIFFKKTKRICKSEEPNMLMYVVPLAVGAFIIAVMLAICCKVKAWILKPAPLPGSLILDARKQRRSYHHVSQMESTVSRLTVRPLVSLQKKDEEENQQQQQQQQEVEEELPGPEPGSGGGGSSGRQSEYMDRSRPGSDYLDSGSDQLDTSSTSLNSDSGGESPYDRPHVCVDLGDGELADGYRA